MATTIVTKKGSGAPAASDLVEGELAVDTTNGRLYTENSSAAVVELGSNPSGNITFGDNGKAIFGAGSDLQIYHDGSNSIINDAGTGTIRIQSGGTNQWEFNGVNLKGNDNRKIILGDSSDLQIYHDGNHSYIEDAGAGAIKIKVGDFRVENASGNNLIKGVGDVATLHHAGSEKLATTSIGIDVTGTVTADGLTVANTSVVAGDFDGGTAATYIRLQDDTDNFLFGSNNSLGNFLIKNETADALRLSVANTGDISFYEDTGTTAKLFWDASAESLGIGTANPTGDLEIATSAADTGVDLILDGNRTSNGGIGSIVFNNNGDSVGMIRSNRASANDAADMLFYTQATGGANAERMRISGGNVLVGKTASNSGTAGHELLDYGRAVHTVNASTVQILNRLGNDGSFLLFEKDGAAIGDVGVNNSDNLRIQGNSSHSGIEFGTNVIIPHKNGSNVDATLDLGESTLRWKDLYLSGIAYNGDGSASAPSISFGADTNTGFYRVGSDQIGFVTAGTIKAKLDASGNFLVGTTSVNGVDGTTFSSTGNATHNTSNTSSFECLTFRVNGTQVGSIVASSGSSTTYNTSSDYRLKENVVAMSGATERLKQLKPSRFNFIANADTTVDGFLAHEVQDIVPEAITGTKDAVDADGNPEYQGIDQSKLVPLLVATIQELEARIAQLES